MWFLTNNIDSQSTEWELIMFINIRVLRLCSTDWKSSLNSDVIYQTKMKIQLIGLKQTRLNLIQAFQDYAGFFLPAKYAQFFGELYAQNPENYATCAIFFSEKLNAFCNETVLFAALQAVTVLVAMASEKEIWRLHFTCSAPI